ncbi:hypothetical protein NCS52_01416100 [Fusarium sp. LHS14.1]|nr:hypothetical protein NCS52_01416100 [Fusarium sp. LHS14.1]
MKRPLPCLAFWEDDGKEGDMSEAARVSSKPARVSSQSSLGTRSADNTVVQDGIDTLTALPCDVSNEELILRRIRSVADPKYLQQSEDCHVSDYEAVIVKVREQFEAKKLGPMLDKFEEPLHTIDQFVRGITVLVQGLDPMAQIIWGGFLILLKNAVRFVDLINTILNCICDLSKMVARFQIYNKMYATDRVKTSLVDVCACCVQFCAAASKVSRRGSIFNFLRLIWDPLDQKFRQLRSNIEAAEKDFVQEVELQQAIETHETHETHELVQAVKTKGPKLPCHVISPAKNRLFFRRPDIMKQIEAHFFPREETSPPRLKSFLLHGLGGSGKTQLAIEFVYNHWDDYDIVIWAVADTEQSLANHFLQAATTLGLPHVGGASTIQTNVVSWLRDCDYKWLIVFDNLENEMLLRRSWPNLAKGSILITSRQRTLGTTMVQGACEVSSLDKEEGDSMIQLLLENKVSDAQERKLVVEMAEALCGLPLALAQMAGYLRTNHVTVGEFLGNYKNPECARRLFGRAASLDHQQHQQTLETVWRLSFQGLSSESKTLLRIVVFLHPDEIPSCNFQIQERRTGVTLPPALQVLEKSTGTFGYNKAMSGLTQQSLMIYIDKELSLSIHRQVQQSALYELLDGDPKNVRIALSGAVQKYTAHVLHLLSLYQTEKKVGEIANTNALTLLTELLCDCGVYLWARCLFGDAERLARASIEVAERALEPHDCLRAQPYTLLGCICIRSGNRSEEAVKSLETALHIRKENMQVDFKHTDPPLHIGIQLANAYSNLGIAAKKMGDFDKAAQLHEKTIEMNGRQRDHCAGFLLALSLHNVGKLHRLQGRVEEAVKFFGECDPEMGIYHNDDEMKARQASLGTLNNVMEDSLDSGMTYVRFGAFKYNAERFEEALDLFKSAEKIFSAMPQAAIDDQIPCKSRLALDAIADMMEAIMDIFQAPSLSVGISYEGQTIWTKGLGFANRKTGLAPNPRTIYSVGSCTKGFTGTSFCLLAERGLLDRDAPVASKIPEIKAGENPVVAKEMDGKDLLSHCVGLSSMPFAVLGRHGRVFARHEDIVQIFNHLPRAAEFKTEWMYNNWLFALAGTLILRESKLSYGEFIKQEIFDKIEMKRTYTDASFDGNHALPYLVFDDKEPMSVSLPSLDDGVAFDSSGSVRSCVEDLLLWSRALMKAWRTTHPAHSHLLRYLPGLGRLVSRLRKFRGKPRHVHGLIGGDEKLTASLAAAQKPHFRLDGDKKQQYALGLFNLNLPTPEMNTVTNPDVNSQEYSIGKYSKERVAIGHTGELGGFLSVYWTFPKDDCAIVVLINSFQINGDPTNLIAQLLAQAIFDMRPTVDFVEVAKTVVRNARGRWDTIQKEWKAHQILNTCPKSLSAYVGEYSNEGLAMTLRVSLSEDNKYFLHLCINGLESQIFELFHYHTDSWTFLGETRDDCIEKGYSMYLLSWESWIIKFDLDENDRFCKIKWRLDTDK